MNSYLIVCVFLCNVGNFPFYANSQTRDENLFLGKYPIPNKMTPDPINIPTDQVKKAKLPPLKILNINFNDPMNLTNNGLAIEATVDPSTTQIITGGPFFDDKYKFYKTRFYFSKNLKKPAATTINGVGTPIEAIVYGYNKKYGTFNNALKYPNGISVISIGIQVGSKRNKKYPPFPKELQKIKHPESSIIVPHKDTADWYDNIPEDEYYYAYPGAYTDLVNKKVYFSATVCVLRPVNAYISKKQFQNSFGRLKNLEGSQLSRSNETIPLNGRPVVKSQGYKQTVNRKLPANGTQRFSYMAQNQIVNINGITLDDTGNYTCEANTKKGYLYSTPLYVKVNPYPTEVFSFRSRGVSIHKTTIDDVIKKLRGTCM